MSEDTFQQYGSYYDLLYRDKDYAAEAAYITRVLHAANHDASKLLEFGSGTGRHGQLLAREGFHVFGVERSASMAKAAVRTSAYPESSSGSFDCRQGDIRTVQLNRQFDAVLSLFHVISYQTTNEDVIQTFNNAARHLRSRGLFLFDVWHGPAVLSERPSIRVKRVEDENTLLTRIAEPILDTNSGVVTVRYTMLAESKGNGRLTTFEEEHRMRYFFPSEIYLLASLSGFEVVSSEEFLTGASPSEKTWGVAYQLCKRA